MSSPSVPPWMTVEHGDSPIVLLAPHGGRRQAARVPGEHKVNDLHTADVTRVLARLLDASAVINERVDRNELDLNRVRQVRRDAPWLVAVLAEMLTAKIAASGAATVLVIHGWNVSQVACDVGIGMRDMPDALVPVRPGSATVSARFVAERLRPLQHDAAAAGILVTIGSRYPAAHPNNLLQLFRAKNDEADGTPCPLASICRTGQVEAVQLELAIPLRWPGARRDGFLAMLAACFGGTPNRHRVLHWPVPPVLRTGGGRVEGRRALQFVADECLVMTSIEAGDEGPTGGRVVLSESPSSLALFTGELVPVSREWSVPPLRCDSQPDGTMRVAYEGPLVRFPNHTPFLDLERGLAGGVVVEARLDVVFEPAAAERGAPSAERFGIVRGDLVVDGRYQQIRTHGVATMVDPPVSFPAGCGRITLPTAACGALLLTIDTAEKDDAPDRHRIALSGALWSGGAPVPMRGTGTVVLAADDATLVIDCREPDLVISARLERMIPVLRPGPRGSIVQTTFALVRVAGHAIGWLELSVRRDVPARLSGG
jgi:hypothetical protein